MSPRRARTLLLAFALAATAGCDTGFAAPDDEGTAVVRVRVTGGIAAADYTYELSSGGDVTGVACVSLCDFAAGDTLYHLSPAQREAFLEAVERSGLPTAGDARDYGTDCCDQFTYEVRYTSGREARTFSGGMENFPDPLKELVTTLQRFYQGVPPVILRQASGLAGFRADPVELTGARADGGFLVLDVRYGGGCAVHDLDAVAWTGWMESHPVQVGVALAHDAHGDACKALVGRTLRFDLEPLRRAYAEAYGPGPATLVLRVEVAGASGAIPVSFSF